MEAYAPILQVLSGIIKSPESSDTLLDAAWSGISGPLGTAQFTPPLLRQFFDAIHQLDLYATGITRLKHERKEGQTNVGTQIYFIFKILLAENFNSIIDDEGSHTVEQKQALGVRRKAFLEAGGVDFLREVFESMKEEVENDPLTLLASLGETEHERVFRDGDEEILRRLL
jgi:hypothetical protein